MSADVGGGLSIDILFFFWYVGRKKKPIRRKKWAKNERKFAKLLTKQRV